MIRAIALDKVAPVEAQPALHAPVHILGRIEAFGVPWRDVRHIRRIHEREASRRHDLLERDAVRRRVEPRRVQELAAAVLDAQLGVAHRLFKPTATIRQLAACCVFDHDKHNNKNVDEHSRTHRHTQRMCIQQQQQQQQQDSGHIQQQQQQQQRQRQQRQQRQQQHTSAIA